MDILSVDSGGFSYNAKCGGDVRLIPLYASGMSLIVLLLQLAVSRKVESVYACEFIGCILYSPFATTTILHREDIRDWSFPAAFFYASVLSAISLFNYQWSPTTTRHNILLLLVLFRIYATGTSGLSSLPPNPTRYIRRRVLMAQTRLNHNHSDIHTVIYPSSICTREPKNPMKEPNPEQTASIFSLMFYFYLDSIIVKAGRVEHLAYDDLPPLPDYDCAAYLEEKGFRCHLDIQAGVKRRHLFFRLLRVFAKEHVLECVAIVVDVLTSFISPIAVNRILSYLEHDNTGITPWFWILWLFLGPLLYGASQLAYSFIVNKVSVNVQSLLMQLVFEHCLRIRVRADSVEGGKEGDGAGKLSNLVTTDLSNVAGAMHFLLPLFVVPLQITLGVVFLYNVLGVSAFVGLFVMLALAPVPRFIVNKLGVVHAEKMKKTDARVQVVTEVVNVLRMVKMFAWEGRMDERIRERRKAELDVLWKGRLYDMLSVTTNYVIATFIMLSTFAFYTVVMKQELTASKVFSSTPVFHLIRMQFYNFSSMINQVVRAKVSLDRLDEFLTHTELLDCYSVTRESCAPVGVVGFRECAFAWSEEGTMFRLSVKGEVVFRRGGVNLITGPTGAGKTSMLMALLGEMHFIPTTPDAWFNLPREGGVAYAAQESWVLNDTIRNNILFESAFDQERYEKVLRQCALEQDIELFDAGDLTEVGERGLTLSGGQKARITLARAIYSSAEIILLDDVLAALDAHTSKWIMEECLLGDLVKGRTVLLVTHNVALVRPVAHFVVTVGLDGGVSAEALVPLGCLPSNLEVLKDVKDTTVESVEDKPTKSDGKLIVTEEIAKGRVGWKALKLFLSALGGNYPVIFFAVWMVGIVSADVGMTLQTWYLGFWGSQYEGGGPVKASYYLSVYSLILVVTVLLRTMTVVHYAVGNVRASRIIHNTLVASILRSTLRWLDKTPVSRIITRCTQDMGAVDDPLAQAWSAVVEVVVSAIIRLGSVVIITPVFLVPGVGIAVLGSWAASVYLKAQLSVKRETSNAKAPILAHYGATVAGLVSVRAYNMQNTFKQELLSRIDHYSRVARISWDLNRWIAARMDFLTALFTASLASYLVLTRSANAANTGFSLTVALEFCSLILSSVRMYNDFEVQSNSLERIQGYIEIEQEKPSRRMGGRLLLGLLVGICVLRGCRRSIRFPEVLHGLSFHVRSGERVGVVGRTGSGKSTLTLALLRCILTEGHVYYDGIATDKINLEALRSGITIIPQMPELLSGTLRKNLDPFDEHDDVVLNAALKHAGLFSLQDDSDEVRITLDSNVASGGNNLSVGQRQIIALARAMVRESKLLILDEATSAIDYKTDVLIQDALRSKLSSDVTVITIAHRLQTIMDADKIMVLDAGNLVEFESPEVLLRKEDGVFRNLVDNSGDSAALRDIAFGKNRIG
ncbi:hypothetical protein BDQ17DRAFT_1419297 [Cyathus striatus]|nr:hypothetical protein BDQ17DRAFT_1419297 [Cyathus striatus]